MEPAAAHRVLDDAAIAAIRALADRLEAEDGAPPLSDRALTGLRSPERTHLLVHDDGQLSGYGQLESAELELAAVNAGAADSILATLPRPTLVWSHGTGSRLIHVFERHGFTRTRQLLQLRRPGNTPPPGDVPLTAGVTVRAFEPGRDENAWLSVNAAAFAAHPEQGRMTPADLAAREAEPWFDPAGFLLAERDGRLLGFHWTKVHPDGAGEVYVLGVSPAAQGLGLGRALLARGLQHLGRIGCPFVLLYVEADNVGALRLYEREMFTRHNLDVQWQTR